MSNLGNGYPPADLVEKWAHQPFCWEGVVREIADWQLDRCCEELRLMEGDCACDELRAICRPKPPSLKQQALNVLDRLRAGDVIARNGAETDTIRRALEALPDD